MGEKKIQEKIKQSHLQGMEYFSQSTILSDSLFFFSSPLPLPFFFFFLQKNIVPYSPKSTACLNTHFVVEVSLPLKGYFTEGFMFEANRN